MYGALLPVTGLAVGMYALIAVVCVVVGSLVRIKAHGNRQ